VMLPPGRGRLATNPLPTGSETITNTIGMVLVSRCSAATTGVVLSHNQIGLKSNQFLRKRLHAIDIGGSKTIVDLDIAPFHPSQCFKCGLERRQPPNELRVALGPAKQHADPAHSPTLLGGGGKRPSGGRAAEQRDELAPLHSLHVLCVIPASRLRPRPATSILRRAFPSRSHRRREAGRGRRPDRLR
jgi:hypothetical protein